MEQAQPGRLLRDVPLLGALPSEARAAVLELSDRVGLEAGEWLFRRGDPGDSCFVVISGRLEVLLEANGEAELRVIRLAGRGAVVGELSLLAQAARSASVRAARDSELLHIPARAFAALLEDHGTAMVVVRELAERLRASTGLEQPPTPPGVVALVSAGAADLIDVSGRLSDALEGLASWIRVRERDVRGGNAALGRLLDEAERGGQQVLAEADFAADPGWSRACLRQADRVIAVVDARSEPPARLKALVGSELLILSGGDAQRERAWIEAVAPLSAYVVSGADALGDWVARTARRLCGRSIGVVLSGGGARGFAHIGALEELSRVGVNIDRVGGCSMGAFVGALFAAGSSPAEIRAVCEREFVRGNPLNDYTVPTVSLIRGQKARRMLARAFRERRIEQLARDYFCVSCDLVTAELVVHRHGRLVDCVGASMNLPGILPPFARGARLLVDGGVLDNLPVATMAERAEGPVIAVDVTARFGPAATGPAAPRWSFRHRRGTGGSPLPAVTETLSRSIGIGSVNAVDEARRAADLLIVPDTGSVSMLEFEAIDQMVEAGRRAARDALAEGSL